MSFKQNVYLFVLTVIGVITLFMTLLYIYDPMQIFHTTYREKVTFHKTMREQNAGVINNYSFDSMILGTSMLENTSADEASSIFGGKFVNLSMSGSDFYERQLVLEYALKHKDIKKIIYSLDMDKYVQQKRGNKVYPIDKFNYLYDDNVLNDFELYFNDKYIGCLFRFSKEKECVGNVNSLDRPAAWYKSKHHAPRYGGLDNWFKAKNNAQIKAAFKTIVNTTKKIKAHKTLPLNDVDIKIDKAKKYIDATLLKSIQNAPDTEFLLFFPPYSRMHFAMLAQYDLTTYAIHKAVVKYMITQADRYANMNVFTFENESFVDDIANYKDPKHYHYLLNSKMLKAMKEDKTPLHVKDADRYINSMSNKALNYNLYKLSDQIELYLKKSK